MKKTKLEAEETIRLLLQTGKKHFAAYGYTRTSLEDIVQGAGLTRGALYHHFQNKQGLFFAVLESTHKTIAHTIEQQAGSGTDPWEQLSLGCRAFITSSIDPAHKQIVLIDGPAVIGWDSWRQLDANHSMKLLYNQLKQMQQAGGFPSLSLDSLTHSLSGAMNESALWIARQNSSGSVDQAMHVLNIYFEGLKQAH